MATYKTKTEETELFAQQLGLLKNSLNHACELADYLATQPTEAAIFFRKIAKNLEKYDSHYLEINKAASIYSALVHFSKFIRNSQRSFSKNIQTDINKFLKRIDQLNFWFNKLDNTTEKSLLLNSSGLFSIKGSPLLHASKEENNNNNNFFGSVEMRGF